MGLVFSHMPCVSPHRFGINMDLSYVCIKELKKNSMCMCSKHRFWVSKWHFLHELDPSLELFQNNLSYNSSYLRITRDSDPTIISITLIMLDEYEYDFFLSSESTELYHYHRVESFLFVVLWYAYIGVLSCIFFFWQKILSSKSK